MVTNSICLPSRCIWLHAKCQSLPPPGQPLPSLAVPQPPIQPHYICLCHRASKLWHPGWYESSRLLFIFKHPPKRSSDPGESSYRDYSLWSVSWGWGGGEQPSCCETSQLHSDADPPQCRWISWPQLPESSQQHLISQLPFWRIVLWIKLLVQLRQFPSELPMAVPLSFP